METPRSYNTRPARSAEATNLHRANKTLPRKGFLVYPYCCLGGFDVYRDGHITFGVSTCPCRAVCGDEGSLALAVIAQTLLLPNWIAGFAGLAGFGILFFGRVAREERMMSQTFGDSYREYMARTGQVFPWNF